jgi:hypothetical protein
MLNDKMVIGKNAGEKSGSAPVHIPGREATLHTYNRYKTQAACQNPWVSLRHVHLIPVNEKEQSEKGLEERRGKKVQLTS